MFMLVTVLRLLLHIVPLSPLGLNFMSIVFDANMDADAVADLAHSCTRFPCYLGMEINAKTK